MVVLGMFPAGSPEEVGLKLGCTKSSEKNTRPEMEIEGVMV